MILPTADVLDRVPEAPVCSIALDLLGRIRGTAGRIRTLRCLEDNALVRETLAQPSDGEILVIDGGGSLRTALLGDQIATLAQGNGWRAVLVFGAVRDSDVLHRLNFHIKCLGRNPRKSAKLGTGEKDVELSLGGVRFVPGHFLYSDADGIVVLPEPVDA